MKIKLCIYLLILLLLERAQAANPNIEVVADARLSHIGRIIAEKLKESNVGPVKYIVTIGPDSLASELGANSTNSIFALYVTSTEFKRIMATSNIKNINNRGISAIYLDIDPRYPVALANLLAPVGKKLITVTGETEISITPQFERFVAAMGAKVIYVNSGDTKEMLSQMDDADVLIAFKDDSLINDSTVKPIISSLYRRKKFLIGGTQRMTTAGALASAHIDMDTYLSQAIVSINKLLNTGLPTGLEYSNSFNVSVNKTLAKALGYYSTDTDEGKLKNEMMRIVDNKRSEI